MCRQKSETNALPENDGEPSLVGSFLLKGEPLPGPLWEEEGTAVRAQTRAHSCKFQENSVFREASKNESRV